MHNLARIGCMARAALYFLIGAFALLVALGSSYGMTTDASGVLERLDKSFGHFVLVAFSIGCFCYASWRFAQSWQDHDLYGSTPKGICIRIGFFFSGLVHAALGIYALNMVFRISKPKPFGEGRIAHWVLLQPFGRFVLLVVGVSVIIAGWVQFVRAFNGSFLRDLKLPPGRIRRLIAVCRFGLVARGIVFVIIGVFFINAAIKSRSREVGGLHKAWETLHSQHHIGSLLLGTVAAGFMAFAVFAFIEGYYHRARRDP